MFILFHFYIKMQNYINYEHLIPDNELNLKFFIKYFMLFGIKIESLFLTVMPISNN